MRPTSKAIRLAVAVLLAVGPIATVAPRPVLATAPANDDFADAQVLDGPLPIAIAGTNLEATVEPGEPDLDGLPAEASVWYSWTADVTAPVLIDTCASPLNARLGVFVGDSLETLVPLGEPLIRPCDFFAGVRRLEVTAGTTYRIAVNGTFGDENPFELRLRQLFPPANDDFADAQVLDGPLPISVDGTNVDASAEEGETSHGNWLPAWSVWFSWTPTVSETVHLEICTQEFGTTLDVYTGAALDGLVVAGVRIHRLACDASVVRLDAVAGETYRIAVDADGYFPGTFELRIRHPSPPGNDAFASATVLEGALPIVVETSNIDATKEPGESLHANNEGGSSIWYAWTAPTSARVAIDPCESQLETLLAVYTGDSVSSLTEVASRLNDFGCVPSIIDVTAGTTYRIVMDGVLLNLGISQGSLALAIRQISPPSNDDFADRIVLTGALPIRVSGTNVDATAEPGETPPAGTPGGASVWWEWTPSVSELVAIHTCDGPSDLDTTLAVYTGDSLDSLTEVAAADDSGCHLKSLVEVQAVEGTTYLIQVDGFLGDTGDIVLVIEGAPPNDDFADAQVLDGALPIVISANNARATKEPGEPDHAGNRGGHSMWYAWTPAVSQSVEIGTCLEAVDTILAVYTGDSLDSLTEVASNHYGCIPGAFVIIEAVAGTNYWIAVDDYLSFFGTSYGSFTLRIAERHPPANDDFAGATTLTGDLTIHASGTNVDATNEPGEPVHTHDLHAASVWYAWTPDESGEVGIDTCGSEIDTGLAVYTGSELPSLTKVASNTDYTGCWFGGSLAILTVTAGTTYHIAVEGLFREMGQVLLHVREAGPPANDDFADAEVLEGDLPVSAAGTNLEASREPGEPDHAGLHSLTSVWYEWASARPEPVVVDTCAATFDTLIGVYTGGGLGALTEVASNDDFEACGEQSLVAFDAAGGRTYRIAVDGSPRRFTGVSVGYFDIALQSACSEVITGPRLGTLKVPAGVVCIHDAFVDGPVRVAPGAQLWVVDSQLVGPVTADGAARVVMCRTSVEGPVRLLGGASVTVGDPHLGCAPNMIDGSLTLKNTGGTSVLAGNTITGKLACSGNSPPPVNRGMANLVLGPATGQCKSLAD